MIRPCGPYSKTNQKLARSCKAIFSASLCDVPLSCANLWGEQAVAKVDCMEQVVAEVDWVQKEQPVVGSGHEVLVALVSAWQPCSTVERSVRLSTAFSIDLRSTAAVPCLPEPSENAARSPFVALAAAHHRCFLHMSAIA